MFEPVLNPALDLEVPLFRVRRGLHIGFRPTLERDAKVEKPGIAARYLALGHRLATALQVGEAEGVNDLARILSVSGARVSTLIGLTFLAPDLQEAVLVGKAGVTKIGFHRLLRVARVPSWEEQRRMVSAEPTDR